MDDQGTGSFVLPGYEVQALLGFGATGEVWQARELASGDTVALKRLKPGADVAAVDLLRREASLLRTLQTPYVVRLRAVLGGDDDVVLVLDHAGGGSLAALLSRRGSLDAAEVVTIAGPLAAALATAHGVGLVHGDVSPANVLFTADGMPLLSDLGVARTAGEHCTRLDGTAEYVDPAVAAGGEPDAAADVWALAAVCHHMLAGSPPHEGASADAVLLAAAEGGRAPLGLLAPSVPRALVAAVEAGLVADPALRPDAAAFASLVRRAHAAAPVRLTGGLTSAQLPPAAVTSTLRSWHEPTPVALPGKHGSGGLAVGLLTWTATRLRAPGLRKAVLPTALVLLLAVGAAAGWASGRADSGGPVARAAAAPSAGVVGRSALTPSTRPGAPTPSTAPLPASGRAAPSIGTALPAGSAVRTAAPGTGVGPPEGAPPPAVPDAQRFAAVLRQLDAARALAFAAADPSLLSAVAVPGSPAMASDRRLLDALARDGRTAHGLTHELGAVRVLSAGARSARLRVVDALTGYEVRKGPAIVARVPARASQPHVFSLSLVADAWRLSEVSAG